jgi:hypothetical protein
MDVHTSRNPKRARARIGRWSLVVPTMPEADRRKVLRARLPTSVWPSGALKVTAVDAQTGEFAVLDSAGVSGAIARYRRSRCRTIPHIARGANCSVMNPKPFRTPNRY